MNLVAFENDLNVTITLFGVQRNEDFVSQCCNIIVFLGTTLPILSRLEFRFEGFVSPESHFLCIGKPKKDNKGPR